MLFADRLEIWNPGQLPPPLTIDALSRPHPSIPRNPLIAEPLFLARYIERAGTGTLDMIALCNEANIPTPEFRQEPGIFVQTLRRPTPVPAPEVTEVVTDQVGTKSALSRHQVEILWKCKGESTITDLMEIAGRSDRTKFRHQVLAPLLEEGLLEMTVPDKPTSSKQRSRLTAKGRAWLDDET
jgi:predicted HTH transcriptional regulator